MISLNSDRQPGSSVPLHRGCIRARERACPPCFFSVFRGSWRAATVFFLLVAIVLGVQTEPVCAQTGTATYTVTFTGNWNRDSTPGGVVGSAHFTTLIGAVHDSSVTFWTSGGTATAGVEDVAESGATSAFRSEITAAGEAVSSIVQESGTSATGSNTFEVTFSRTHPLLTLLSMIGPSPDWFVGVSGLSMLDESSAWRPSHEADLFPYDAGTEDGESFSLGNPSTDPRGTITSLRGMGRFSDTRMAGLSFKLKTVTPPECIVSDVIDDKSLKEFVECAAKSVAASGAVEETNRLLEEFRARGNWNDGITYLVLLTAGGGVYFHANDGELEESDWSEFVFCEGGVSVLDSQEGCFIGYEGERRGYAHPFSASHVPMARGEEKFVLLGGFDKAPDREPSTEETDESGGGGSDGDSSEGGSDGDSSEGDSDGDSSEGDSDGDSGEGDSDGEDSGGGDSDEDSGGGGCAVGGSGNGGVSGLLLAALTLFLAVSLKRHLAEDRTR